VNTEIIDTMPMVMPKSERNVRNLLTDTELRAKRKLSLIIFNHIVRALFSAKDSQI
jgi:hypothetical protein